MQVQCSQALCRRNRVPMLDFAETAQFSFQAGPERIRKYARLFGVVTNVIICFVHFQAAVIYILYVATSFQQVRDSTAMPEVGTIKRHRDVRSAILTNKDPMPGITGTVDLNFND